ncbi:MAG: ArdC family protein [Sphingomicrobium sp.]
MGSRIRQHKPRLSRSEVATKALRNAMTSESSMNYAAIYEGFEAMGIPAAVILPRQTVFSYNAWHALGRQVRKGEHGVKVVTWIEAKGKKAAACDDQASDGAKPHKFPRTVTVFHLSQTDVIAATAAA